ncbi:MAG: hypothetical protein KME27_01380 [Lyngbya sp. HA4199-MV5]|jgi:FtsZ-binding cell division protein ZapB|nr:hypothetical protein [Lyngbya sp. HA4199-MV5]
MAQTALQAILNQLRELEIEELKEVNQAVQQYLVARAITFERTAFDRALLDSGLIEQLKQPHYRQETDRQLLQVQGKPLSETIIEERR